MITETFLKVYFAITDDKYGSQASNFDSQNIPVNQVVNSLRWQSVLA